MSRFSTMSRRGWQRVYRFYAYHFTAQMTFLSGVWILYLQHRGYSLAEIGLAEAAFHLAPILFEIPSGSFADLAGRRWSLATSSLLVVIANVLLWRADTLAIVMLALFLDGASYSFRSGADQAYLYDALNDDQRGTYGRFFGRLLSAGYLAGGLTTWVGAVLSERSYWIPLILSSILAVSGIILAIGLDEPARERTQDRQHRRTIAGHVADVRSVLRAEPVIAMMLAVAALFWTVLTIAGLYAQAAFADRGLGNGQVGIVIGLTSVAIAIGTGLGGQLGGSFARQWPWLTAATGVGVALIGLDAIGIAVVAYLAGQLVSGILETRLSVWYNDQLPSGQRATVLSVESWLFSCLMIVLFPLGGWFAERAGWSALYIVCGAVATVMGLASLILRNDSDPAGSAGESLPDLAAPAAPSLAREVTT